MTPVTPYWNEGEACDMSTMITDEGMLRRYVLGQALPEEDGIRLDERMAEDDFRELVEATEDEILVEYFRGDLVEDGRDLIARLSASPAGRDRLELARSLATVTKNQPVPVSAPLPFLRRVAARPLMGGALAALAAALVAVAILIPRGPSSPPVPFN